MLDRTSVIKIADVSDPELQSQSHDCRKSCGVIRLSSALGDASEEIVSLSIRGVDREIYRILHKQEYNNNRSGNPRQ